MSAHGVGEGNRLFTEFKGALTENYVLQAPENQLEVVLPYWSQTNPPYEVDFLIQREKEIFSVEVKAEAALLKYKEVAMVTTIQAIYLDGGIY